MRQLALNLRSWRSFGCAVGSGSLLHDGPCLFAPCTSAQRPTGKKQGHQNSAVLVARLSARERVRVRRGLKAQAALFLAATATATATITAAISTAISTRVTAIATFATVTGVVAFSMAARIFAGRQPFAGVIRFCNAVSL